MALSTRRLGFALRVHRWLASQLATQAANHGCGAAVGKPKEGRGGPVDASHSPFVPAYERRERRALKLRFALVRPSGVAKPWVEDFRGEGGGGGGHLTCLTKLAFEIDSSADIHSCKLWQLFYPTPRGSPHSTHPGSSCRPLKADRRRSRANAAFRSRESPQLETLRARKHRALLCITRSMEEPAEWRKGPCVLCCCWALGAACCACS